MMKVEMSICSGTKKKLKKEIEGKIVNKRCFWKAASTIAISPHVMVIKIISKASKCGQPFI